MTQLLDKGADPNARVTKKVWYSGYNFDLSGIDEVGATPFWRAAYGADVEAMKLLVAHGADPQIPTAKPPGRPRTGDADIRAARRRLGHAARFRPAAPASRRCTRRRAPATAKASPPTRIATRRAACCWR